MDIIIKESQYKWLILEAKMKGNDEFITKAQNVHKDSNGNPLYDYSLVDYQGAQTKVKIICPRHKDEWKRSTGNEYFEMTPNHHLNGRDCRYDYLERKTKYSDEDILKAAKKYKSTADFKANDIKKWYVAINRSKKNEGFYKKISKHFETTSSYGEDVVANILIEKELIPKECVSRACDNREKTFTDCVNSKQGSSCRKLRFDFYLPNQNTLIEFDGEPHFVKSTGNYGKKFETQQEYDIIKNKYCKDKGIKLIRIHYKAPFNEIEGLLLNALKSTKQEILIGPY